ncbi:MAG: coniferyl aldehyde dehydrogenase [Polyangiaceae bacterium]
MSALTERMQTTFDLQRRAALEKPFPSLSERRDKLKRLRDALKRHQDAIVAAIYADFEGRSPFESRLVEVFGPMLEIDHALRHLKKWMKPKRRATELLFLGNGARVQYQPKGVVGIIGPWNFPVYTSIGPLVTALAAGNRAMVKMSEFSPRTTEAIAKMMGEIFAEDEVAIFSGEMEEAKFFSELPFHHMVFTGSPAVGKHVMRAASGNLTPVTLELGGKSPTIVGPEASIRDAARVVAHGKSFNGGQICVSPDYCLVPRAKVEAFTEAVIAAAREIYPDVRGNAEYTAMITERHAKRIDSLVDDAKKRGAKVLVAGERGNDRRIPLHVVSGVTDEMAITKEELFGPILPVVPYDTLDDAITYINARERPLALYPIGLSSSELDQVLERTHSGGVCVGDWGWQVFNHDLPFGGVGNSGMGTYHGEEGFRELSHQRGIFIRKSWFPVQLFYPPYGNFVQRLVMRVFLGHTEPKSPKELGAPGDQSPHAAR